MRDLLIRYLLGELDQFEHEEVRRRLLESPELRKELENLRSCFSESCRDDLCDAPPPDLAGRTTELITQGGNDAWHVDRNAAPHGSDDPPAGVLGWSLADLTVAGGVVLAVSMLIFPALGDSRNATRRTVCQNNQYQLWQLAARYADDHGNYYPAIAPHENAGMFAVRLAEMGYIAPEDLAVILVCPGAPFADAIRSGRFVIRIHTSDELNSMPPQQLVVARRHTSPFFDYRLPARVGDNYVNIRDERSPYLPVFSDRSASANEHLVSPNHGGGIIQVTFQDGSVRSRTTRALPNIDDDISFNRLGLVAAGVGRQDVVLGRSDARPAFQWPARGR